MAKQLNLTIKNQGFSLLEILIAMAIMAVMIGIAVPYLGNSNEHFAKQEANRLVATIELVRDLAVIENKEYGLSIDEEGYQFLILNDEDESKPSEWQIIEEHPELNKHEFPEEVVINVAIDGENIFKAAEDDVDIFEEDVDIFEEEEEKEKIEPPQIYFLSTGEQNAFAIGIASADEYQTDDDETTFFRLKGDLSGNFRYEGYLPGNLFQDINEDFSDFLDEES